MTVANPLLTRRATLQAAIEAAYRQEASVGNDDGILVEEPQYNIDANTLDRNITRNDISPLPVVVGRKVSSMTFTTEIRGNGLQQSGQAADAPLISRLFRACGFSLTAVTAAEAGSVIPVGDVAVAPTWVAAGTLTNTDLHVYHLEVTTGGASAAAQITVTDDGADAGNAAQTVTSGSPINIGAQGLTLAPTWTGDLRQGDKWVVVLYPAGIRLDPVSDNFESLTMVMNIDGVEHKMLGCFGTFSITATAGEYATIDWDFTGTYVDPTDAALPTPNYETTLPPIVELARLRVENFYAIVNEFTFDLGNDIQIRPDVSSIEGYVGTRIVNRVPEGGIDPEAELVASHDFWGKMAAATRMPFHLRIGSESGNTVWFITPSTQYTGLSYQDRNGIRTYDAGLRFSRVTGNDEFQVFFM